MEFAGQIPRTILRAASFGLRLRHCIGGHCVSGLRNWAYDLSCRASVCGCELREWSSGLGGGGLSLWISDPWLPIAPKPIGKPHLACLKESHRTLNSEDSLPEQTRSGCVATLNSGFSCGRSPQRACVPKKATALQRLLGIWEHPTTLLLKLEPPVACSSLGETPKASTVQAHWAPGEPQHFLDRQSCRRRSLTAGHSAQME